MPGGTAHSLRCNTGPCCLARPVRDVTRVVWGIAVMLALPLPVSLSLQPLIASRCRMMELIRLSCPAFSTRYPNDCQVKTHFHHEEPASPFAFNGQDTAGGASLRPGDSPSMRENKRQPLQAAFFVFLPDSRLTPPSAGNRQSPAARDPGEAALEVPEHRSPPGKVKIHAALSAEILEEFDFKRVEPRRKRGETLLTAGRMSLVLSIVDDQAAIDVEHAAVIGIQREQETAGAFHTRDTL